MDELHEFESAAIDLPGCNTSQKLQSSESYVTGNVCRILAAALSALGRDSCVLVGVLLHPIYASHKQAGPANSRAPFTFNTFTSDVIVVYSYS